MGMMNTFDTFSTGRDNNFNLIRMLAASMVLVSHAFPISLGYGTIEPLQDLLGLKLGTAAVYVFFAISGFLISQSFERSQSLARFIIARILRIFPGLLVALTLTAFLLGPYVTTLPLREYFSSPAVPLYLIRNLILAFPLYELPGVFTNNPYGGAINGSLWTLVYEVTCYMGVLLIGLAGAFQKKWQMAIALTCFAAFYAITMHAPAGYAIPGRIINLAELGLPFAIGTAFYVWRTYLPLGWALGIALASLTAAAAYQSFFHELFVVTLCYWVFLVGYLPGGIIRAYNRLGDYSYGVYIYAFPIQQLVAHYLAPMAPIQNMVLSAPATLALAVLSWHLIEKPALTAKSYFAQIVSGKGLPANRDS